MMLAVYIIGITLQSSSKFTINNKTNIEMLNIAETYISDKRNLIKYSDNENFNLYEEKQIGKYKIVSKVIKNEDYYQCYKINVIVSIQNKDVEVNTYVTKQ